MDFFFEKQRCRLCQGVINNENFEKISVVTKDILDILLLKLDLDESEHVMCMVCALKVKEALKFKAICLYTDSVIIPYVDETQSPVDLLKIYAKERGNGQSIDTLLGHKICRLCMRLIKDGFKKLHNIDAIKKYIPELVNVVEGPVVCKKCFDFAYRHSTFVKNCLEVEEENRKSNDENSSRVPFETSISVSYTKVEEKQEESEYKKECPESESTVKTLENENKYQIKTKSIDIKSEEDSERYVIQSCGHEESEYKKECLESVKSLENEDQYQIKTESTNINSEGDNQRYLIQSCRDEEREYESESTVKTLENKDQYQMKTESIDMKSEEDSERYAIQSCRDEESEYKKECHESESTVKTLENEDQYQIKTESIDIKSEDDIESETFHRNVCSYTNRMTIYEVSSDPQMFKCMYCSFVTKYTSSLKIHIFTHKMYSADSEEVEKIRTMLRETLQKHPLEVRYKCDVCTFKTIYKNRFETHLTKHKTLSEVQTYKCFYCDYEGKYKMCLRSHIVSQHRDMVLDPEENRRITLLLKLKKDITLKIYKCDKCDYDTTVLSNFRCHQKKHGTASCVFQCTKCSYQTVHKQALVRHQRGHEDRSDVQMYRCNMCTHETKYKDDLKMHRITHKCMHCDYEAKYKSSLTEHIIHHHKDMLVKP